jgi:hypothetical protein
VQQPVKSEIILIKTVISKGELIMNLETFKKNAKNDFVVINVLAGTRLNAKGTNLKETASLFLLTIDREKEFKVDTPEAFKENEAVLLEGIDRETGNFVI